MISLFLDPSLNLKAGTLIAVSASIWTVLSITLTSEPANVLAMSGVALILVGLQIIQGSLQLRKIEDYGTAPDA